MKKKIVLVTLAVCFILISITGSVSLAAPISTAFTYQGRLIDSNSAADGSYDFQFKLYDAPNDGNQLSGDINMPDVDVIDGSFTMELDFDESVYDGNSVWLEIGVRAGELEDPNAYTLLDPRQKITPAPYAVYATKAAAIPGGSENYIPKFLQGSKLGNSVAYESNGNIGIGTTSPEGKLHIYEDSDVLLKIDCDSTDNDAQIHFARGAGADSWFGPTADDTFDFWVEENIPILFATNGEERARITEDGDLEVAGTVNATAFVGDGSGLTGITTTETDPIFAASSASAIQGTDITNWDTAYGWGNHALAGYLTAEDDPQVGPISGNHVPKWDGSALVTGTIYDNGNVGIGTMSPTAKLQVTFEDSTKITPALKLENTQGTDGYIGIHPAEDASGAWLSFSADVASYNGEYGTPSGGLPMTTISHHSDRCPGIFGYTARTTTADSRFYFLTSPKGTNQTLSEVMTITNGGNVGVGTTSPNSSKGSDGYLDVKDVYLRDSGKWASESSGAFSSDTTTVSGSGPQSGSWDPPNVSNVLLGFATLELHGNFNNTGHVIDFQSWYDNGQVYYQMNISQDGEGNNMGWRLRLIALGI